MVQNSEEEEQNEVVIPNDVYQNEVNNKVLEEEQSEEIDFYKRSDLQLRCINDVKVSMWVKVLYEGEIFLGKVLCVENGDVQVRYLEKPFGVEVGAPQDMEVESSCAWFHKTWRWNHHVLGSRKFIHRILNLL